MVFTFTNPPKWMLSALILSAVAGPAICRGCGGGARRPFGFSAVCGWSPQLSPSTPRSSRDGSVLLARGGSIGDGADGGASDDTVASGARHSFEEEDPSNGEDEMRALRRRWSDLPATPSISWPIVGDGDGDSGIGMRLPEADAPTDRPTKAIIIMDGFCPYHGQYLSQAARRSHGAAVIHVLSDFVARYLFQVEGERDHLSARLPDLDDEDDVAAWKSLLPPSLEICGVYCESDSGLDDAERLGVALGLSPRCHDGVNAARRDKFLMNEAVSRAGLDTVKQRSCRTLEEAEEFARALGLGENNAEGAGDGTSPLVVVKPLRGVASDDVHLCTSLPSLREAFGKIHQSPVFGSSTAAKNQHVLVQEFASGDEYAIDVVCSDGERKVAALWKYDKRAVNGAPFVYHATELVSATNDDGVEREVCDYVFGALEALGLRWGLSHVEVIASTDPSTGKIRVRLVEVNCRQHNTDFMLLTNACVGYNALDMVLSAHLGDGGVGPMPWDDIPALPTTRARGAIVHFVSHVEGTIKQVRYDVLREVEDLPSVMDVHVYPQFLEEGSTIRRTVDIRTDTGWAHLINTDGEEFEGDYQRLVDLMKDMFEVAKEEEVG